MTLREYLTEKKMTVKDFAKFIGFSNTHIYKVLHGKAPISEKFKVRVEAYTRGRVKMHISCIECKNELVACTCMSLIEPAKE